MVEASVPEHLFANFKQTWQGGKSDQRQTITYPVGLVQEVNQEDVTVHRVSHSE